MKGTAHTDHSLLLQDLHLIVSIMEIHGGGFYFETVATDLKHTN